MTKIKTMILAIIMTTVLFLSGCGGGSSGVGPSSTPFVGGSNGLSIEFIEGAPPERVLDSGKQEFTIGIQIENMGESEVKENDGYIEISGVQPEEFSLSESEFKQNLPDDIDPVRKYSDTVVKGGVFTVTFEGLNYEDDLPGNWEPRIRANLCYNYETNATTAICVKKDMMRRSTNKDVCELNGEKDVFNSGAPIQITNVKEIPTGEDKLQLTFDVSHVGAPNDRFYKVDTDCDDDVTNMDRDKVYFEISTDINGNKADCSGLEEGTGNAGYIKLRNGVTQTVVCNFNVGDVNLDFEKLINVKLGYRYYQFIEKNILIEDVE